MTETIISHIEGLIRRGIFLLLLKTVIFMDHRQGPRKCFMSVIVGGAGGVGDIGCFISY